MKQTILFFLCMVGLVSGEAQVSQSAHNSWLVMLQRKDGRQVPFQMEQQSENGKAVLYIINATERIKITNVQTAGDSIFFTMPAFESSFRLQILPGGNMRGTYIKGTSRATQYWPVHAYTNMKDRFTAQNGNSKNNISGRWDVSITRANGTIRKAVALLEQQVNKLT